jgi:hypothetical protein
MRMTQQKYVCTQKNAIYAYTHATPIHRFREFGYQQEDAIQRVEATIYIVTQEKIVVEGRLAANFKQF